MGSTKSKKIESLPPPNYGNIMISQYSVPCLSVLAKGTKAFHVSFYVFCMLFINEETWYNY